MSIKCALARWAMCVCGRVSHVMRVSFHFWPACFCLLCLTFAYLGCWHDWPLFEVLLAPHYATIILPALTLCFVIFIMHASQKILHEWDKLFWLYYKLSQVQPSEIFGLDRLGDIASIPAVIEESAPENVGKEMDQERKCCLNKEKVEAIFFSSTYITLFTWCYDAFAILFFFCAFLSRYYDNTVE